MNDQELGQKDKELVKKDLLKFVFMRAKM